MRDAAGQLAKGVHLLGFRQLPLHLLELLLCFTALGNIAGDLCKSDQSTVVVPDRVNDNAGPEKGTVLPDAPAFFLVVAGFLGNLQGARWLACRLICRGVEARKILSYDFSPQVSFPPTTHGAPVRNAA